MPPDLVPPFGPPAGFDTFSRYLMMRVALGTSCPVSLR